MTHHSIDALLARYSPANLQDHERALREIVQELALLGLWRAKFYEHAAFYGGTALRIFHGLPRFSEDLDFSLTAPSKGFRLEPFLSAIKEELEAFGFHFEVEKKSKTAATAIESAFIKGGTRINLLGNNILDSGAGALRVGLHPWMQNSPALVSWFDMERFSAHQFVYLTELLAQIPELLQRIDAKSETRNETIAHCAEVLGSIAGRLRIIGCDVAASEAEDFREALKCDWTHFKFVADERVKALHRVIQAEMGKHVFFWVPPERARWHGKKGRELLGAECVERFAKKDIANEAEQAARCFAFGQYTACAFHLMRVSEAGVYALGLAIGYAWEDNPNWGRMFKSFDHQSATDASKRVGVWKTDGDFLAEIGGHFRAVKNAWRNDTMHLDKTYDEDQAKHLLAVIPAFMKQLASRIDENGKFCSSPSASVP